MLKPVIVEWLPGETPVLRLEGMPSEEPPVYFGALGLGGFVFWCVECDTLGLLRCFRRFGFGGFTALALWFRV